MTDRSDAARESEQPALSGASAPRKKYEPPRLVDYGAISKLTLTGGVTIKDQGSMMGRQP